MDWLDFVMLGLAAQRLTAMWFVTPMFSTLRDKLIQRGGVLGAGANCAVCTTTWVGVIVYLVWSVVPYSSVVLAVLAVGSLASFINSFTRGA
jgi:hypothetical protein